MMPNTTSRLPKPGDYAHYAGGCGTLRAAAQRPAAVGDTVVDPAMGPLCGPIGASLALSTSGSAPPCYNAVRPPWGSGSGVA
jgi:hypothetical protein